MHSSDITAASVSQSFTHKMAAKTEWHTCRYEETKLRHSQPRSSTGRRRGASAPHPGFWEKSLKLLTISAAEVVVCNLQLQFPRNSTVLQVICDPICYLVTLKFSRDAASVYFGGMVIQTNKNVLEPQGHYPPNPGMVIIARWPLENNLNVWWAQVLHAWYSTLQQTTRHWWSPTTCFGVTNHSEAASLWLVRQE